jgi:hypothetical protein
MLAGVGAVITGAARPSATPGFELAQVVIPSALSAKIRRRRNTLRPQLAPS